MPGEMGKAPQHPSPSTLWRAPKPAYEGDVESVCAEVAKFSVANELTPVLEANNNSVEPSNASNDELLVLKVTSKATQQAMSSVKQSLWKR